MTQSPTTAIFADTPAKGQYLSDIARYAGYDVLETPAPDSLCIISGTSSETVRSDERPLFLSKILPPKFRACDLIKILQAEEDLRLLLPLEVNIKAATLYTRQNLWCVAGAVDVQLTQKETQLICYLKEKNRAVSRNDLLSDIWGYVDGLETHTLETHIYRLRQKIEPDPSNPIFILTQDDGYQLSL